MIHVEIISSCDPLALGLYDYEYDHISIGRSKKNDIIFLDKELPTAFLILEILEDKSKDELVVRSLSRQPYFFVNGKKISGLYKIYENDVIAFGENKIRIVKYKRTKVEEDLSMAFKEFEKNAPELGFALEFIEEILIDMEEKAQNV